MIARASPLALLVACWTSNGKAPVEPTQPPASSRTKEHHATLRIDAAPSGKKFQGVWLEFANGKRWVLDYRPRTLWTDFADMEVVATGHCYEPLGQAIMAPHFHVDRLRFANPERGRAAILEIGPEVRLRGAFVARVSPPGSKLAGTSELVFDAEDGTTYNVHDPDGALPEPGTAARVIARELVIDLSYAATTGGPTLFVLDVQAPDATDDPRTMPRTVPCPE